MGLKLDIRSDVKFINLFDRILGFSVFWKVVECSRSGFFNITIGLY